MAILLSDDLLAGLRQPPPPEQPREPQPQLGTMQPQAPGLQPAPYAPAFPGEPDFAGLGAMGYQQELAGRQYTSGIPANPPRQPANPYGPEAMAGPDFGPPLGDYAQRLAARTYPHPLPGASSPLELLAPGSVGGELLGHLGRPSGAVRGALGALNRPINQTLGEAARGFMEPSTAPSGMDIGALQHLPDRGIGIGPLNLTPRTIAGFGYDAATDPLSYVGGGVAKDVVEAYVGGRAVKGAVSDMARAGAAVAGAAEDIPHAPLGTGPATQALYAIRQPEALSAPDRQLNILKEAVGIGTPQSEVATPIMRERQRVQQVVESQSARLGALSNDTIRVFKTDKYGRIGALPGQPTIQDVAARLPEFGPYLNAEQRAALAKLQAEVSPFSDALAELGVDLRSRADVQEGGFYLPRGRADIEGADAPRKIRSGRGMAGTKQGFERGAVFDSMAQGIDAGYEYSPLRDALQSYAQDAGNRAVDKFAVNHLLATGFGETAKERIIEQAPQLVQDWQQVNREIASIRGRLATAEKRAGIAVGKGDELDTALAAMQRAQPEGGAAPLARIPTMMVQEGERAGGLSVERIRAVAHPGTPAAYGLTGPNLLREAQQAGMERVLGRLDELVPDSADRVRFLDTAIVRTERRLDVLGQRGGLYATLAEDMRSQLGRVQEQYSELAPEYKRALERAQQTPREQGVIGFSGLQGTTFPDEMANAANKFLNAEKPPTGRGAGTLTTINAFNGFMRGLRASADLSATAIQGLLGAVTHPVQYGRAMVVAMKALGSENALGAYINDFDRLAAQSGKPSSREWAANGLRIGGTNTEFNIGKGLGRVAPAVQNAPIIKQSNRSFGFFGDALRLETADVLATVNNLARTGRPMAEIAQGANLITGWSSRRFLGETGALVQFAPRFLQSQLELVTKAITLDPSIAGNEARTALIRLIGVGTLATVAANEALGNPTDFNPKSPNFMRIRLAGQDSSLFGPWDSLLRAVTAASQGDFTYAARTKASPAISIAWDLISGKTFTGQDARTPEALLRNLLPFGLSQAGQQGQGIGVTAVGLTGLKTTPLTLTERVQEGDYGKLQGEDQLKGIRPEAWRQLQLDPKAPASLKQYDSYFAWADAKRSEITPRWLAETPPPGRARLTPGEVDQKVQQYIANDPTSKALGRVHDRLKDAWVVANPQLALDLYDRNQGLSYREQNPLWSLTAAQLAAAHKVLRR